MSAPGNRRHRNHALALRHLFVSTVWKLQLVSSRVAKSGELASSNPSLHHPGDPYSGIRSTWGFCRSEEKMDSWPNGPGLWIKPLLWKATGITEVCCESPWLKQSMGISICLKTRSPLELALAIVSYLLCCRMNENSTYLLSTQLSFLINHWGVPLLGSCCRVCHAYQIDSQSFKRLLILLIPTGNSETNGVIYTDTRQKTSSLLKSSWAPIY